uniref:Uncharacterized protein n=1 Tax=Arundo donax TaxID=35708 RepID=A0A0A9EFU1_ARUDO
MKAIQPQISIFTRNNNTRSFRTGTVNYS